MFEVKATFGGETRKFTLRSDNFPSYVDLCAQLERVFTINEPYTLSKLLFSPSRGTSVVVGYHVSSEEEYNQYRAPFSGRLWPNGLLRFTVLGGSGDNISIIPLQTTRSDSLEFTNENVSSHVRRPPATSDEDMDDINRRISERALNRHSFISDTSRQSCCSVDEGKSEMKELMSSFLRDFNSISLATFGETLAASSTEHAGSSDSQVGIQPATPRYAPGVHMPSPIEDTNLGIPGAFVEPAASTVVTDHLIHCGSCEKPISGYYHKCNVCADYDLCGVCVAFQNAEDMHKAMFFRDVEHSFSLVTNSSDAVSTPRAHQSNVQEHPIQTQVLDNTSSHIHSGVVCDACNETIVGPRHKCLNCYNFDLCDNCYPSASLSHNRHEFMTITDPGAVSTRRVHSNGPSRLHRRSRAHASSEQASNNLVHQAICDLCDSRIQGLRYKCLACPDFDTCASCHRIVGVQHPTHNFVKIESPQDLSSRDASAFFKHNARCDECGKTIRGIRYKCMHPECPDFDLCTKCEAMPFKVHPETHPLLKMHSPNTIIPTVYRVGGTQLLPTTIPRPFVSGVAVSTEPEPEKADASVYAETIASPIARGTMVDAGVHAQLRPQTSEASISVTAPVSESEERHNDLPLFPTPPPHSPVLAASIESIGAPQPEMIQSRNDSQQGDKPVAASLFSSFVTSLVQRSPSEDGLRATFVIDLNVQDGQVFPAGTQFVKTWCMRNDGNSDWPESTNIIFIAGDRMSSFAGTPMTYTVGTVRAGETKDISVGDLKAPELPGKYIGYWRLTDGVKPFGQSVWCDITVPELAEPSPHSSLSASQVIMPEPTRAIPGSFSGVATPDLIHSGNSSTPITPVTSTAQSSASDYDSASDSLLDEFDTMSDDELWEATRNRQGTGEYVVLYDNESTDEEALH